MHRRERGLHDGDARQGHLTVDRRIPLEIEPAQQRLQAHALQHQRAEDDREGGEHDWITAGKTGRQGNSRDQRHQPTHAAPTDERGAPKRRRIPPLLLAVKAGEPPYDRDIAQHPDDARHDDDGQYRCGEHKCTALPFAGEPADDRPRLQAHQHESQHVEHEHRRLPDRIGADAAPRRHMARCGARDGDGIDDDGDDGGKPDPVGDDPDGEGSGELHHGAACRILDARHPANLHVNAVHVRARFSARAPRCTRERGR